MRGWPIALAVLAPLALLLCMAASRSERWRAALPLASLPALLAALVPGDALELPTVLLQARLAVDDIARPLLLTGLAWSAAAWFAADRIRERFRSFALFWLATLAGTLLATLAADLATFYTGYVTMTLAAYGLVIHERGAAALRAGRVYLVLALGGEALLLSGLLTLGASLGNADMATLPTALQGDEPTAAVAGALLLAGLSVKIGVVPLHVWLPLAHPVAPVPASAILSGVLVKAGLLGALRTVPDATVAGSAALTLLLALGLFTAFYGAAMGLGQQRLKTVLAYSTISQMGLLFTALALALQPGAVRGGPLLALLVLHHGLNKAALFLAAGCAPGASRWRLMLLALPLLSLAGVPPGTGALAKSALKAALEDSAASAWAASWLAWSSLATALLMLRVFDLARRAPPAEAPVPAVHPGWWLLVVLGASVPWWQAASDGLAHLPDLWASTWPAWLALLVAWAWQRLGRPAPGPLPEGDLLQPAEAACRALGRLGRRLTQAAARLAAHGARWRGRALALAPRLAGWIVQAEAAIVTLPVVGVLLLSLAGLAWWALA